MWYTLFGCVDVQRDEAIKAELLAHENLIVHLKMNPATVMKVWATCISLSVVDTVFKAIIGTAIVIDRVLLLVDILHVLGLWVNKNLHHDNMIQ